MPSPPAEHAPQARLARRLALGFLSLMALTFGLIVLGALVRAHEAGLACPDWPLCFGKLVPEFDLKVAFEWGHRAVAGVVLLCFAGLAAVTWRSPLTRTAAGALLPFAGAALIIQALLGALTVWLLLAEWTVTAHLVVGNSFNACLLLLALRLHEVAKPRPALAALPPTARSWVTACAVLLALQMVLGGLVSSSFSGLACPEWPTCNGGLWFPAWGGSVGLHLAHRMNGYLFAIALAVAFAAARGTPGLARIMGLALGLGLAQVAVGVANVLLSLPVEVTGLHSALAAALVLTLTGAMREAWRRPGTSAIASAVLEPAPSEQSRA